MIRTLKACALLGFHVGSGGAAPLCEGQCSFATGVSEAVAGDTMLMTNQRRIQGRLDLEEGTATSDANVWTLVFRQTMPVLFRENEWRKNADDPDNANFAILDRLEDFRVDGSFEFKLVWPNKNEQIWRQTSNPVTTTAGGVEGYEAIDAPYTRKKWGGLEYCTRRQALLDGSVNHGNWWFAVGAMHQHGGGIPGPDSVVNQVELYVSAPPPAPTPPPTPPPPQAWTLVARQTMPGLFSPDEWSKNAEDPDSDNYAILDRLEEFRVAGSFEFKLVWPDTDWSEQHWRQTSNPVTRTEGGVEGYEAIQVPYSVRHWGGLEYCTGNQALLDGSASHVAWWYAIGAFFAYENGIPGPGGIVDKVELYVYGPEDLR